MRFAALAAALVLVAPVLVRAASPADGQRLYQRYCATCHGAKGDGNGPTASRYPGAGPRDFTRGLYELRSTATGQLPLTTDLVRTLARGVPGTIMPAWEKVFSTDDLAAVARYIEGFSPRFAAEPESARKTVSLPAAPAVTRARLRAGRAVFLVMGCTLCHGPRGDGHGLLAPTLRRTDGRPIAPADFTRAVHKSGDGLADLFRTVSTGLDGTPMPSFETSVRLTRESAATVQAFASQLDAKELAEVKAYLGSLPTAAQFGALSADEQARRRVEWRWDVAMYVRQLGHRSWWRGLLGL